MEMSAAPKYIAPRVILPENRMISSTAIVRVQGQMIVFQLRPKGPNMANMKRCIATAATSEIRRNRRVKSPSANAIWMKGAAIPNQ